jgi:hypothetical protein
MYRLETYWIEGDDPVCYRHTQAVENKEIDPLLQIAFMERLEKGEDWVGYRVVHSRESGPEPVVFEKFMDGSVKDRWSNAFEG